MLSSEFVEDIFIKFCGLFHAGKIPIQPHDVSVIMNFEMIILEKKSLTSNQGNFLIKILQKYQNFSILGGLDYSIHLENPVWKETFRILDLSKRIFVEKDEENNIWVCLKFPYQLKKHFEEEFQSESNQFSWDNENKIRKIRIYNCNLISVYEFCKKNAFEIDESFIEALAQVEEIWESQENLIPHSSSYGDSVMLFNACAEAAGFFEEKRSKYHNDLLLAKSMGFKLTGKPKNLIEKISASDENHFWIKDFKKYFDLIDQIDGKIAVILDRSSDILGWLKLFSDHAIEYGINPRDIKVCFREEKHSSTGINDWIRENGYGGKVEEGKILIFLQKPAKWLFKDVENVKIVTTTSIYPSPNPIARDFINSHPCVIYLGDIKPSEKKEQKIVEL